MPQYSLELGDVVKNLICECCGFPVKRVWGFVSKDGSAHAVYYALLAEHPPERWVGLTLSVGNWWDEKAVETRQWVHLQARNMDGIFALRVSEPQESNFYPWERGGKPLSREEALVNKLIEEFYAVADYVNVEDPAIDSFLSGKEVNIRGRVCEHSDHVEYGGESSIKPQ